MSGIDTGKKGGDGGGKTTATTMCRRRVGQRGGGGDGVYTGGYAHVPLSRQPKKKVKSVHFSDVAAADAWAFTEGKKRGLFYPYSTPSSP